MRLVVSAVIRGLLLSLAVCPLGAASASAAALKPGDLLVVDPATAGQTEVSSDGFLEEVTGIAIAPNGQIFVTDCGCTGVVGVIRVDPATGAQSVVSSGGSLVRPSGIAMAANGDLLVVDQDAFAGQGGIIRINPVTGAQTPVSSGADAGGAPHVRVFSLGGGLHEVTGFYAFAAVFGGGARVAAADVDGSGRASILVGAGPGGGPQVRVLKWVGGALQELASFYAYDPSFTGGVFVGAGDVNGDGRAEVITGAGAGGAPHVRVFTGAGADTGVGFLAYDPAFTGGVAVSAGP